MTKDEIWLSHLRPNEKKWLALAGDYPHTLVGIGDDAVQASESARENGYPDAMLMYVPPFIPLSTTPFIDAGDE